MADRATLERMTVPEPPAGPKVSMERVTVTSPGMVQGVLDDQPYPIDGDTSGVSAGMAITIDGHRVFVRFGA